MIIDVPSAAIEPFEPHGLPRLHISDAFVQLALWNTLDYINSFKEGEGGRIILEGVRYIIETRLKEAGAKSIRVVLRGPFTDKEIPYCSTSVHYSLPGRRKRLHHVGGPLWSKGGFRR